MAAVVFARGRVLLCVVLLLWPLRTAVPPDHAASIVPQRGTIHLSIARGQSSAYGITASGTFVHVPSAVYVDVHTGGCAASFTTDDLLVERQVQQHGVDAAAVLVNRQLGTGLQTSGTYSDQETWGLGAPPGTYWVCGYLMGPQGAEGQPSALPEAKAAVQLRVGGPTPPPPAPTLGPTVLVFYTTSLAVYRAMRGGQPVTAIPHVGHYAAGTRTIVFYIAYRGARPGATTYSIRVPLPHPWQQIAVGSGTHTFTTANGELLTALGAPTTEHDLAQGKRSVSHAFPPGIYQAELQVNGRLQLRTAFLVGAVQ